MSRAFCLGYTESVTSDPVERYLLKASRVGRRARLRPMQLGELFDLSMRVYRVLGWRILAASAVPTVFSLAGFAFLLQYVMPGFASTTQGTSQQGQVAEAAINMLLGIFVAGPLILIGISMATTYIAPLVSNFMHGLPPDYKAAQQAQWKSAPRMLWVSIRESLIAACGVLIGGLLLFLSWILSKVTATNDSTAGVVLGIGWLAIVLGCLWTLVVVSVHALVAPVASLENASASDASKRSRGLMKSRPYQGSGYDSVWSLYGLILMLSLALYFGAAALNNLIGVTDWAGALDLRAFRPVILGAANLAPIFVTLWVTVPVWAVTVTIIYFERRVRLEGYDIEALAADLWQPVREDRLRA